MLTNCTAQTQPLRKCPWAKTYFHKDNFNHYLPALAKLPKTFPCTPEQRNTRIGRRQKPSLTWNMRMGVKKLTWTSFMGFRTHGKLTWLLHWNGNSEIASKNIRFPNLFLTRFSRPFNGVHLCCPQDTFQKGTREFGDLVEPVCCKKYILCSEWINFERTPLPKLPFLYSFSGPPKQNPPFEPHSGF